MNSPDSTWFEPLSPVAFLRRSASVYPDKKAVAYGASVFTYSEFWNRVRRLADFLESLGIGPGDRVALLCWNTPPILEAHFAVPLIGAVMVPINTRLLPNEVLYILEHSGASVLIVDSELALPLAGIESELPEALTLVTVVDTETESPPAQPFRKQSFDYEESLASCRTIDPLFVLQDENAILSINYTSGTTGRPKGVMVTHRGAALNAFGTPVYCGLEKSTKYLWTLPMFHCNGWYFPYSVTLVSGTHVLMRKYLPEKVFDLVESEGVTHFCGAPTVMLGIVQFAEKTGRTFPHPVRGNVAGAPPSPTLLAACKRIGIGLAHLYGLTETYGPHTACEFEPEWAAETEETQAVLLARQGVATTNALHLRVVDEEMKDVPRDGQTLGEVVMRGNNVMKGYYSNPEATETAFRGGWFHSGDLAVWHPDGYIEVRDRGKDIIISGGENISSIEVEKTLVKHPAVLEAAVIAIPDEKWGEVPKAFVSLKEEGAISEADLIAFCRENLSHFKCPKTVEFRELPKTATGKIQKFVLREKEWSGLEKRVN